MSALKCKPINDFSIFDKAKCGPMEAMTDSEVMSARERIAKISVILAGGILRLRKNSLGSKSNDVENLSNSSEQPLDVSFKSPLSVTSR